MNKDLALKAAIWVIPVLFGMGAMYQTVLGSSVDVVEVKQQLDRHEDLRAHPVTEEKLDVISVEQKALRVQQTQQGENIAAICQATNARCK
jgi:archaellum component FlaF (FlaF/FlaG flagellin family)